MNRRCPSQAITQGPGRGELPESAWGRAQFPKPRPLTPGQIALGEWLRAATRHVDQAEIDRFFAEIDAIVDPAPRYWPDCED